MTNRAIVLTFRKKNVLFKTKHDLHNPLLKIFKQHSKHVRKNYKQFAFNSTCFEPSSALPAIKKKVSFQQPNQPGQHQLYRCVYARCHDRDTDDRRRSSFVNRSRASYVCLCLLRWRGAHTSRLQLRRPHRAFGLFGHWHSSSWLVGSFLIRTVGWFVFRLGLNSVFDFFFKCFRPILSHLWRHVVSSFVHSIPVSRDRRLA